MRNVARPLADINITPLIDVMLVLLIIYMVVVPVSRRGLDAALPEPASRESNGGWEPCSSPLRRQDCALARSRS
jgi:biopolymer transport protein ExbD